MRLLIVLLLLFFPQWIQADLRPYPAQISPQEQTDIRFIIGTLANTSSIGLMFKKKALENAGNRTDNVHPLNYIGFIFSDPVLKQQAKKINGIAWNRFVGGLSGSFEKAKQRGNIDRAMMVDFSKQVHLDSNLLIPYFSSQRWGDLINVVRDKT